MLSPDLEVSSITSSSSEGNEIDIGGDGGAQMDRDLLGVVDRNPNLLLDRGDDRLFLAFSNRQIIFLQHLR